MYKKILEKIDKDHTFSVIDKNTKVKNVYFFDEKNQKSIHLFEKKIKTINMLKESRRQSTDKEVKRRAIQKIYNILTKVSKIPLYERQEFYRIRKIFRNLEYE